MRAICCALALLTARGMWCAQGFASDYLFRNAVDSTVVSGTPFSDDNPAVDHGVVAFYGNGSTGRILYMASSGNVTPVVKRGDTAPRGIFVLVGYEGLNPGSDVAISHGKVAFSSRFHDAQGTMAAQSGVMAAVPGALTPIAVTGDAIGSQTFTEFGSSPAIEGDAVAFLGRLGTSGVYLGSGGAITTIAKLGDAGPNGTFSGFGEDNGGSTSISGGRVAFRGRYAGGDGIFVGSGGALTTIAKRGDAVPNGNLFAFSDPAISGNDVAFAATTGNGRNGIYLGEGGALTTIVQSGQSAPSLNYLAFGEPALSDGSVAFLGYYLANGLWTTSLYVGNGGPLTEVIKTGDPLFGSTLLDISFGRRGMDQDGSNRLAFGYSLQNGARGIAFAELVPEPACATIAAVAAVGACLFRRRV